MAGRLANSVRPTDSDIPDPTPNDDDDAVSGQVITGNTHNKRAVVVIFLVLTAVVVGVPVLSPFGAIVRTAVEAVVQEVAIPLWKREFKKAVGNIGVKGVGAAWTVAGAAIGAIVGAKHRGWQLIAASVALFVGIAVISEVSKEFWNEAVDEAAMAAFGGGVGAFAGTAIGVAFGERRVSTALRVALGSTVGTVVGAELSTGIVRGWRTSQVVTNLSNTSS